MQAWADCGLAAGGDSKVEMASEVNLNLDDRLR
jgi:hypothetical protein